MKKPSKLRAIAGDVVEYTLASPVWAIALVMALLDMASEAMQRLTYGAKPLVAIVRFAERTAAKVRG